MHRYTGTQVQEHRYTGTGEGEREPGGGGAELDRAKWERGGNWGWEEEVGERQSGGEEGGAGRRQEGEGGAGVAYRVLPGGVVGAPELRVVHVPGRRRTVRGSWR